MWFIHYTKRQGVLLVYEQGQGAHCLRIKPGRKSGCPRTKNPVETITILTREAGQVRLDTRSGQELYKASWRVTEDRKKEREKSPAILRPDCGTAAGTDRRRPAGRPSKASGRRESAENARAAPKSAGSGLRVGPAKYTGARDEKLSVPAVRKITDFSDGSKYPGYRIDGEIRDLLFRVSPSATDRLLKKAEEIRWISAPPARPGPTRAHMYRSGRTRNTVTPGRSAVDTAEGRLRGGLARH
jgi:hypothetical protein